MASPTRSEVVSLVLDEIAKVCGQGEDHVAVVPDEDTRLMGTQAPLDSVELVSLIVSLEQLVESRFGTRLQLVDDRTMSRRPSPFRTAGRLADYLLERIGELR